jgi:uncharacterized surface protein with fasciclin (FAS1) repeats
LGIYAASCIPPLEGPPPDPRSFDSPDTDLKDLGITLPYFGEFVYALERTNLTHLLEDEGPYTVFAPVQASFSTFRIKHNISHIDQYPKEKLSEILRYHFVQGKYSLYEMPEGYHQTLLLEKTTSNPIDLFIEKYDVFRINGLHVIDEPDLASVNGYIQSIKSVLEIPDLMDHLSINKDFSMILKILKRRDVDPELIARLTNEDRMTFFAPSNAAIRSYLESHPDWKTIDDVPPAFLNEMLSGHIVDQGNIVLNDIFQDISMNTLSGREISVHIDYPKWRVVAGTTKIAELKIRDIQASNGIIHQVNRVFLP